MVELGGGAVQIPRPKPFQTSRKVLDPGCTPQSPGIWNGTCAGAGKPLPGCGIFRRAHAPGAQSKSVFSVQTGRLSSAAALATRTDASMGRC